MKRFYFCLVALFAVSQAVAQQSVLTDEDLNKVKNMIEMDNSIWKGRAKYFNIGYVWQTLSDKTYGGDLKSDAGVSLSWGKTFYLHKEPLLGMVKFGLDWSWLDVNYAKSAFDDYDADTDELFSSDVHQAEIGMQFGPSVTVNPVDRLKASAYFRVTPSYSMLYLDETVHHHYVTFCNAGLSVAWRVVSLGVEWRWGTAKYDGLAFDEENFEDSDDLPSLDDLRVPDRKFKTNSFRFYFGFRF